MGSCEQSTTQKKLYLFTHVIITIMQARCIQVNKNECLVNENTLVNPMSHIRWLDVSTWMIKYAWHVVHISRKQSYYPKYTIIIFIIRQQTLAKWTPQGHDIEANYIAMCRWSNVCSLQWRHNERDGVLKHRRRDWLHNRLFRRRSKKTSNLGVTGLRERNSPVTGDFPPQRVSNAENVSIWWRHDIHNVTASLRRTVVRSWHRNAFRVTGPLWGEPPRWLILTKGQ